MQHPEIGACAGHRVDPGWMGITLDNCVRNYGDENAVIIVNHENGNRLHIHLRPAAVATVYLEARGRIPVTVAGFEREFPLDLVIVPTLGPFEAREEPSRRNGPKE